MPMRDLHHNIDIAQATAVAVINTDTNGGSVDGRGFEAVEHIVVVGDSADTLNGSNTIALELEDSPDDSTWTNVTDANYVLEGANSSVTFVAASGQFALMDAAAEDSRIFNIGYRGPQRYSRVVVNFTGTHSTGTPIGLYAIRWKADERPTSHDGT